jgi:hypothetical protein
MEFVPQLKGAALSVAVALAGGEAAFAPPQARRQDWSMGAGRPGQTALGATTQDKSAENENAGRSSEP